MVTNLRVKPQSEQVGKINPFVCAFKSMGDNKYEGAIVEVSKQLAEQFGMSVVVVDMAFYTSGIRHNIPSGPTAYDTISSLEKCYNKCIPGLLDYFHDKCMLNKSSLKDVVINMNVSRGKVAVLPAKRKLDSDVDCITNSNYALDLKANLFVKESSLWDSLYNDLIELCLGIDIILINTPLGLEDSFNKIALADPAVNLVFYFSDRVDNQEVEKSILRRIATPDKIITVANNSDSLFNKSLLTDQSISFTPKAIADNILAVYNKK